MFFWAGQEGGSGSRGGALPRRPIGSRPLAGEPRRIASGPPPLAGEPDGCSGSALVAQAIAQDPRLASGMGRNGVSQDRP